MKRKVSPFFPTRPVAIGSIFIGGNHPIAIQTMTNTDTNDITATVQQIMELSDAGASIVRLTVQGKKEAKSCEKIKNILVQKGYNVPLVADIHFYPPAALFSAEFMDKVRINPGNFADKRASFAKKSYTNLEYQQELHRIEEKFTPLVKICKRNQTALRIGVNHGSLSDRILNVYGDTPKGMVASAFEFAEICRKHDFHQLVFSMKSSNPLVMIAAYRHLIASMQEKGWDYPLHLGVTEAGAGDDGRIKSSLGIGALLLEGIGDTIRISLTEDPIHEMEPCRRLLRFSTAYQSHFVRKKTERKGAVSAFFALGEKDFPLGDMDRRLSLEKTPTGYTKTLFSPDALLLEKAPDSVEELEKVQEAGILIFVKNFSLKPVETPLIPVTPWKKNGPYIEKAPLALWLDVQDVSLEEIDLWDLSTANQMPNHLFISAEGVDRIEKTRRILEKVPSQVSTYIYAAYEEDLRLMGSAAEMGSILCDGWSNGFCLAPQGSLEERSSRTFSLLQAARLRSVKTEFISCPGCGRTLFDLQEVSERIRQKTGHLPGVKVAIMGCIVNGPGEMADADFGYVGSRPGKVDLYVGKTCVEKYIDFADADAKLIQLIKDHGKWVEPTAVEPNQ